MVVKAKKKYYKSLLGKYIILQVFYFSLSSYGEILSVRTNVLMPHKIQNYF